MIDSFRINTSKNKKTKAVQVSSCNWKHATLMLGNRRGYMEEIYATYKFSGKLKHSDASENWFTKFKNTGKYEREDQEKKTQARTMEQS